MLYSVLKILLIEFVQLEASISMNNIWKLNAKSIVPNELFNSSVKLLKQLSTLSNCFKVAYFPGDPGEDENDFDEHWTPDSEPVACETDKWATQIVNVKQPQKNTEEGNDDLQTSRSLWSVKKSMKNLSMSTSKKSNKKRSKNDLGDTKSRLDNSQVEKKENYNVNMSMSNQTNNDKLNFVQLEVEPPREIPEEEKYLRDRKERQLKAKEVELREQREKEEKEKQRMKSKMDEMAQIEKKAHTYDDSGQIILVKKPNLVKIQDKLDPKVEFSLQAEQNQTQQSRQPQIRIKSARTDGKKKQENPMSKLTADKKAELLLEQQAEQEVIEKYQKIYDNQQEASIEYGQLVDGLDIKEGIIMLAHNRRIIGPPLSRSKMTLKEYQKISQDWDLGNERMNKYSSQKKIKENPLIQISEVEAGEEVVGTLMTNRKGSPEKMFRKPGADEVYDKELSPQEHKMQLRAQRKNLKSATARLTSLGSSKSKMARLNSAQQKDIRIRQGVSKDNLKGKIFNYENYIGGVDIPPQSNILSPSQSSKEGRPMSALQGYYSQNDFKSKKISVIDEYNKKIIERGGPDRELNHNELPEVIKNRMILNQNSRPQTAHRPKIMTFSKKKLQDLNENQSQLGLQQNQNSQVQQKRGPRERIISAKIQKNQEKLPPPPFGKTMGHGFLGK